MKHSRAWLWTGLGVAAALAALWWVADHRRGLRWAIAVVKDRFPDVPQLATEELSQWQANRKRPAPVLLDARSAEEFALSHLSGALHIDPDSTDEKLRARVPVGVPLVAYCSAGYRGSQMARRLRALGFTDVSNLSGGIFQWANEGREVVRHGTPTREVHPVSGAFARLLRPENRPR